MGNKRDFFVSYTKKDRDWATWIAWQLEQEGFSCHLDVWDFVPGTDFVAKMRDAMDGCDKVISVLSQDYFMSSFAQAEMQAGFAADLILPVRVRKCEIPKLYRSRIYIDLVEKAPVVAQRELIDGVKASLVGRRPTSQPPFPERPIFPGQIEQSSPELHEANQTSIIAKTTTGPLRILLLGAEAETGLDIRGEFNLIKKSIAAAKGTSSIRVKTVFDVTAKDLFAQLNRFSPRVFHFSGKQDAGRILMRSDGGGVVAVDEGALSGMLRALDQGIQLAILDTCYSFGSAREITDVVDCAIGVRGWIYDYESTMYYVAFYQAIATGRSLKDACAQASTYCQMNKVPKTRIPQLVCRRGVDAGKIKLVAR